MKHPFVILLIAIFALSRADGSQPAITVRCNIPELSVTAAGTPEYANISASIQSLGHTPLIAAFQPYSLVVTNRSGHEIVGVSLDMVLEDAAGRITHKIATRTTFNASSDHKFTPGRNMNLSVLWLTDVPPPAELQPEVERLLQTLERQKSITLVVDGALLASRQYIGPNDAREFEHLDAMFHAGHDLAQRVVKHFENNGSDEGLVVLLNSTASIRPTGAPGGVKDWYADIQATLSKHYLQTHARSGPDAVLRMARAATAQPPMNIFRQDRQANGSN